ncbi:hypothetical protein Q1695_005487 [Nippostrongylus brasiliensis]|nr:hypothetical protein Q1695_005487 [Nippostrongylus brasiliensis]
MKLSRLNEAHEAVNEEVIVEVPEALRLKCLSIKGDIPCASHSKASFRQVCCLINSEVQMVRPTAQLQASMIMQLIVISIVFTALPRALSSSMLRELNEVPNPDPNTGEIHLKCRCSVFTPKEEFLVNTWDRYFLPNKTGKWMYVYPTIENYFNFPCDCERTVKEGMKPSYMAEYPGPVRIITEKERARVIYQWQYTKPNSSIDGCVFEISEYDGGRGRKHLFAKYIPDASYKITQQFEGLKENTWYRLKIYSAHKTSFKTLFFKTKKPENFTEHVSSVPKPFIPSSIDIGSIGKTSAVVYFPVPNPDNLDHINRYDPVDAYEVVVHDGENQVQNMTLLTVKMQTVRKEYWKEFEKPRKDNIRAVAIIKGLRPKTRYSVKVRSLYRDADPSDYSKSVHFTTLERNNNIPRLNKTSILSIDEDHIEIAWLGEDEEYIVSIEGKKTKRKYRTKKYRYRFEHLIPDTEYEIQIARPEYEPSFKLTFRTPQRLRGEKHSLHEAEEKRLELNHDISGLRRSLLKEREDTHQKGAIHQEQQSELRTSIAMMTADMQSHALRLKQIFNSPSFIRKHTIGLAAFVLVVLLATIIVENMTKARAPNIRSPQKSSRAKSRPLRKT